MLFYWAHFLSQVRHSKLIHLRRFERELFLDVILISQLRENRPRLRSTRSQEQKLLIELPFLLKIACISLKKVHIKRILLVSPFNALKSTRKTKVTCTCQLTLGSISGCLGQNNLKIISLF